MVKGMRMIENEIEKKKSISFFFPGAEDVLTQRIPEDLLRGSDGNKSVKKWEI